MASTPGIRVRHSRTCRSRKGGSCSCEPTYEAWVYSRRDGKKIRRSFTGKGAFAAARGWRTDAMKAVRDRRLRAPSSVTVREEVEQWLAGVRAGSILNKREQSYKPAVVRNYELALRLRVLPELGDRKLADVDLSDLLELKEALQGAGCSPSVIRNTFVPLAAIYRRARLQMRVVVDPTIDLPLPTAASRERAATPMQAAELLEPLGDVERAVWATAFSAGLRRGELRALRVNAVDLAHSCISVQHAWDDKEGEITPKSSAGVRRVFILAALRPHIEPLVTQRPSDAFVFGSDVAPFEPRALVRKAERAWAKADKQREQEGRPALVRFTLHEARHSFSTWLDHAGVSPDRADRYMGHSSGSVAGRYRHLLPAQMAEDAKQFDAYLVGAVSRKVVPRTAAG